MASLPDTSLPMEARGRGRHCSLECLTDVRLCFCYGSVIEPSFSTFSRTSSGTPLPLECKIERIHTAIIMLYRAFFRFFLVATIQIVIVLHSLQVLPEWLHALAVPRFDWASLASFGQHYSCTCGLCLFAGSARRAVLDRLDGPLYYNQSIWVKVSVGMHW